MLPEMKAWVKDRKEKLLFAAAALGAPLLALGVSAEVNLSGVSEVITAIVDIIPDLIDLVVGIVPIIVVIALVGFIVTFFDRILGMLKLG